MQKHLSPVFSTPLSLLLVISLISGCSSHDDKEITGAGEDWPVYLADHFSSHYSKLEQINPDNIDHLELAWEYHTGDDISGNHTQIQCNPIILNGILYGTSPSLKVFALDAATGNRIWEFDPDPEDNYAKNVNRGVSYWQNGQDKRILFTSGSYLFAINAETGIPVEKFGKAGKISLTEGLGERAGDLYIAATSPGIVYNYLLIIGSRVSEEAGASLDISVLSIY